MTPDERAEKILYGLPLGLTSDEKRRAIAAEIRAAVEDEHQRFFKAEKAWAERWRKGVLLTYADAARIAREFSKKPGAVIVISNAETGMTHADIGRAIASEIEARAAKVCK